MQINWIIGSKLCWMEKEPLDNPLPTTLFALKKNT
jgi:hypothetical protein